MTDRDFIIIACVIPLLPVAYFVGWGLTHIILDRLERRRA